MRLGRSRRLRKGPEFERVFSEGAALGGPFAVVRAAPNNLGYPRWAFVAGKRAFPRAVNRNRARRLLRGTVQALAPRGSFDVVIIARPDLMNVSPAQRRAALSRQLRRAGLEVAEE
jgi:ribonuclease P protein component